MKIRHVTIFCLMITLGSCEVLIPDFFTFVPDGERTAFVRKTTVVNHTDSEIIYDVEFQLIDRNPEFDYRELYEEDLIMSENVSIQDFEEISFYDPPADEVILLIDQSRDYDITDPHNARAQLINKFAHDFDGDLAIGGFSSEGLLTGDPIEYLSSSDTDQAPVEVLFRLASRTGGNSNLYDALNAALDDFGSLSTTTKHLVVLVQSNDEVSTTSELDVIAKAKSKNVHVDIISLGESAPLEILSTISQQTSGFFAACNFDKEMISMFHNLDRILNGINDGYKINVKLNSNVAISSGSEMVEPFEVLYYEDQTLYNRLYSFIKVP